MTCDRNICYEQDYNGGCDTCPCNDKQSMTNKEIIEQLESLKCHCKDFMEEDSVWSKDVEALEAAIEVVEKQIPKKPILRKQMGLFTIYLFHCPVCDDALISEWNKNIANPYCHHCGQAIDWSDGE